MNVVVLVSSSSRLKKRSGRALLLLALMTWAASGHAQDHLLQNVVVINEELDDLRHFSASDDLVLLSKSGRFTRKRSVVSGGSVGLFEGKKIGRAKNLEKLLEDIHWMMAALMVVPAAKAGPLKRS